MVEYKVNPVEHLGLVKSIALRYVRRNPSLALDDCISVGYEGLLKGCELFDSSRGVQPSTYLYKVIWSFINNWHLKSKRFNRELPILFSEGGGGAKTTQGGRGKTLEEATPAPMSEDTEGVLLDRIEKELAVFRSELTLRQRDILDRRILKSPPETLQTIADTWNCSRQMINQNERLVLKKLRKRAESWKLNDPT